MVLGEDKLDCSSGVLRGDVDGYLGTRNNVTVKGEVKTAVKCATTF